jgi:methylase of polypeptide subunit release factors
VNYNKLSHLEYAKADLETYELIRTQKDIEKITHNGISISIFPNVFSPKYFTDSFWFAEEVTKIVGTKTFLEVGSGTGVVSLFAAIKGAKVTCLDINPDAVRNTEFNLQQHGLNAECFQSDLFQAIKPDSRYDFIFWNHPFFEADEVVDDILLRAGFDYKYQGLERYLQDAFKFLSTNGKLLLGTGDAARLERFYEICERLKLNPKLLTTVVMPVNPGSTLMNDYRIYEIKAES